MDETDRQWIRAMAEDVAAIRRVMEGCRVEASEPTITHHDKATDAIGTCEVDKPTPAPPGLLEAVEGLLKRLSECDEAMQPVYQCSMNHGVEYDGPTYTEEEAAVKRALARAKPEAEAWGRLEKKTEEAVGLLKAVPYPRKCAIGDAERMLEVALTKLKEARDA